MKIKIILSALLLIFSSSAFADGKPSKATADVGKAEWVDSMKSVLPSLFCKKDSFFRKCFSISEDECIETAVRASKACLAKSIDDIPSTLHQPHDGGEWGQKIGACTGGTMELAFGSEKKKKDDKDCNDPSKWVLKK